MATPSLTRVAAAADTQAPAYAYHQMRAALDTFKKSPADLDELERKTVTRKAAKSFEIESLVLNSAEVAEVMVTAEQVAAAVGEIRERYEDEYALHEDLQRNGLDIDILHQALHRELLFDAVMQHVGARHAVASDIDIRLFYEMHRERFQVPEKRVARHILLTVNDDFEENTWDASMARMEVIADKLDGRSNRFASLARKYSECPTAMDGGKLGEISKGQLFPELDAQLFCMEEGEISGIVETEIGFHLLYCERIEPGRAIPLSKVRGKISEILERRNQRNCQKAWLAGLRQSQEDGQ